MFYRPGGTSGAPNRQQDYVYSDTIGGATDWLPVNKGDTIAVNIARASIVFASAAQSAVTATPFAAEYTVVMELRVQGGQNPLTFPIDQWQNLVVATDRRSKRAGWVRLKILNINNSDGTGLAMALQINRTGESGVVN